MSEGNAEGKAQASASGDGDRSDVRRAEELIEQWGQRFGGWLGRVTSRAREEAEDILAEAKSIRRG
jgi:hypothetical protein